jgi:hypothetical protein
MPHNHEFDCKQCGAHLDSRQDLDKHMREKHTAQVGQAGDSSSFGTRSASPNQNPGNSPPRNQNPGNPSSDPKRSV